MTEAQHFAELLLRKIREDLTEYRGVVASGRCDDFPQYQNLCGKIRGLEQAEEHTTALLKKVGTDDDADE